MEIKVRDNNVERALKTLKRQLGKEGLFRELKSRRFYEKPSIKEKRKRVEAGKKKRRALRSGRRN